MKEKKKEFLYNFYSPKEKKLFTRESNLTVSIPSGKVDLSRGLEWVDKRGSHYVLSAFQPLVVEKLFFSLY